MTFFGLKQGQDLENRAAHLHQEFSGVLPGQCVRKKFKGVFTLLPINVVW